MIVTQRLPAPSGNVWYLAYGSNLSASKFIHDRQIHPVATAVVTVPGWTLIMDSAGVPYSEPAFASISAIHGVMDEKSVQLIGTAYELTPEMYRKVLASEGGGIAYAEVEVRAQRLVHGSAEAETQTFATRSLVTVLEREARPSKRYMNLLRTGAREVDMPSSYQKFLDGLPVYEPSRKPFPRVGAALFLSFWVPLMSLMEWITKTSLNGNDAADAPPWVIFMVRAVVLTMWWYHDYVHAPIWGRGDGIDYILSL